MKVTVLGIDLAKSVFQLHGVNEAGKAVLRLRLSRKQLLSYIAQLPPCLIGMEACGSAHHWAREFRKHGHDVRLIAIQFVKPYVKSNKNDEADAAAICEAVSRPHMRFVSVKTTDQQDIQAVHRIRERLVCSRTALSNEIRGLLAEYGVVFPKSVGQLRKAIPCILSAEESSLSPMFLTLLRGLYEELRELDKRISELDQRIELIFKSNPICQKLGDIPGIGPVAATALVASVGDPSCFKNGRQMSAWLGIVPRQASSGGVSRLLGISKRGDTYIRKLLIHGARSALRWIDRKSDPRSLWAQKLIERRGKNRAAVAFANKMSRIAWVLMTTEKSYQEQVA